MNYVYAARFGDLVKIGTSHCPADRIRQVTRGHTARPAGVADRAVADEAWCTPGGRREEAAAHARFAAARFLTQHLGVELTAYDGASGLYLALPVETAQAIYEAGAIFATRESGHVGPLSEWRPRP